MKRYQLKQPSYSPTFIGSWELDSSLCDKIVDFFERHKSKQVVGTSGSGGSICQLKIGLIFLFHQVNLLMNNTVFLICILSLWHCVYRTMVMNGLS